VDFNSVIGGIEGLLLERPLESDLYVTIRLDDFGNVIVALTVAQRPGVEKRSSILAPPRLRRKRRLPLLERRSRRHYTGHM
jgi:hypothetical protein